MSRSRRILILLAHPALESSRVNAPLAAAAARLQGVTVHDLYERYPDFDVDVPREQSLLTAHDIVVAQHPFYWYSVPALLKEWMDLVLQHGWAYGRGGDALAGKGWMAAVTTGGGESDYRADGASGHTMEEFMRPLERTARLCGMRWMPPFIVHGTHRLDEAGIARHAEGYAGLLEELRGPAAGDAEGGD